MSNGDRQPNFPHPSHSRHQGTSRKMGQGRHVVLEMSCAVLRSTARFGHSGRAVFLWDGGTCWALSRVGVMMDEFDVVYVVSEVLWMW